MDFRRFINLIESRSILEALSDQAVRITLEKFGPDIERKLQEDPNSQLSAESLLRWIADDVDPTVNSKYTRWIWSTWLKGGIRFVEDMSKLTDPLERYAKLCQSQKIPVEKRDIQQFKSLDEFLDFMDQYSETKTKNEVKSNEEQALLDSNQAQIFYNDANVKIVIPLTKQAAIFYGKNTRWCTSAIRHNYFKEYTRAGAKLYIILLKKLNKRYQFSFKHCQFMDEQDKEISERRYRELANILPSSLYADGLAQCTIRDILDDPKWYMANQEMQLALFNKILQAQDIDDWQRREYLRLAIEGAIEPRKHRLWTAGRTIVVTKECLKLSPAVQMFLAKHCPSELIDASNDIYATELLSKTIKMACLNTDPTLISRIHGLPNKYYVDAIKRTPELFIKMVEYIDITPSMELAAVKGNPSLIRYIKWPEDELITTAISRDPSSIRYIEHTDNEMRNLAVKTDPSSIQYIKNPSVQLQMMAVSMNPETFTLIKDPAKRVIDYVSSLGYKA